MTITKTQTSITISGLKDAFSDSSNITDVRIYYSKTTDTPTDYVSATGLDSVTISNLYANSKYYLYYQATDEYGNTQPEAIFFGAPVTDNTPDTTAPNVLSLAIGNITSSTFDIVNFNLVSDDRDTNPNIKVYWSLTNTQPTTTTKSFDLTFAKSNTIQVSGLTNGKKYYVWVVAEDASGNKATKSLEATTLDSDGPTGTNNLAVGGATATSIDVTGFDLVTDNVGVTNFDIYYSTSATKPSTANTTLTKAQAGSKYTITSLTASTSYYVWVDAKDAAGNVTAQQVNTTAYSTTAVTTTAFYNTQLLPNTKTDMSTSLPLTNIAGVFATDEVTVTTAGLTFAIRAKYASIASRQFNLVMGFQSDQKPSYWESTLTGALMFNASPLDFRLYTGGGMYTAQTFPATYASTSSEFTYVVKIDQANSKLLWEIYDNTNKVLKEASVTRAFADGSKGYGWLWLASSVATLSKLQMYTGLKTIADINPI